MLMRPLVLTTTTNRSKWVQEEDGPAELDAVPAGNDQQPTAAVDSDDESASGGVIGEMEVDAAKAGNGGKEAEDEGNSFSQQNYYNDSHLPILYLPTSIVKLLFFRPFF